MLTLKFSHVAKRRLAGKQATPPEIWRCSLSACFLERIAR